MAPEDVDEVLAEGAITGQPYVAVHQGVVYAYYMGIIDFLQEWTCGKEALPVSRLWAALIPLSTDPTPAVCTLGQVVLRSEADRYPAPPRLRSPVLSILLQQACLRRGGIDARDETKRARRRVAVVCCDDDGPQEVARCQPHRRNCCGLAARGAPVRCEPRRRRYPKLFAWSEMPWNPFQRVQYGSASLVHSACAAVVTLRA